MTPPDRAAILDLANSHGSRDRAVHHFTKRGLLDFAEAVLQLVPASVDAARLDALAEAAGFMRGMSAGDPAYRVLGSETWHPDLRAAIDEHSRTKARDAQEEL